VNGNGDWPGSFNRRGRGNPHRGESDGELAACAKEAPAKDSPKFGPSLPPKTLKHLEPV